MDVAFDVLHRLTATLMKQVGFTAVTFIIGETSTGTKCVA